MPKTKERNPYAVNVGKDVVRVIVEFERIDVQAIDDWGVPAGMTNRSAAIRAIIKKGLEANASTKEAVEQRA